MSPSRVKGFSTHRPFESSPGCMCCVSPVSWNSEPHGVVQELPVPEEVDRYIRRWVHSVLGSLCTGTNLRPYFQNKKKLSAEICRVRGVVWRVKDPSPLGWLSTPITCRGAVHRMVGRWSFSMRFYGWSHVTHKHIKIYKIFLKVLYTHIKYVLWTVVVTCEKDRYMIIRFEPECKCDWSILSPVTWPIIKVCVFTLCDQVTVDFLLFDLCLFLTWILLVAILDLKRKNHLTCSQCIKKPCSPNRLFKSAVYKSCI